MEETKIMSAEQFAKKHFPKIENETWFPAIIAIAEGYWKYRSALQNKSRKENKKIMNQIINDR